MSIKETLNLTREKRTHQVCKVFELKVDASHLSKKTKNDLNLLFVEAKSIYNHFLAQLDSGTKTRDIDTKIKEVLVKVKEDFETRELTILSSQMKQGLLTRMENSLKALSALKKKGYKVGKLKFKSFLKFNAIPLKQYGNTYRIINGNYIHIQNIDSQIKVEGLKQIKQHFEIANANLTKNGNDFFIKVTCYINTEDMQQIEHKIYETIGIDFGCQHQLVLSNGIVIDYLISNAKRLRVLNKEMHRRKKHSKNYNKTIRKRQKTYRKENNQKKDIKKKIIHVLNENVEHIIIQDENVKFFQKKHGKKIQKTGIGGITGNLKKLPTTIVVDQFFPSTKQCFCGAKQEIPLWQRTYSCPECGLKMDRDLKAARIIEIEGCKQIFIPSGRRKSTPAERAPLLSGLKEISHLKARVLVETGSSDALAEE
jgi:putative transposase